MTTTRTMRRFLTFGALALLSWACTRGNEPAHAPASNPAAIRKGVTYRPEIRPDDFVETIDNPYHPLVPGTVRRYAGQEDGEKQSNVVNVTDRKKTIMGVETTVVDDRVYGPDGELLEKTFDWFAQDSDGNVWYFGEDTKEYEDGKVSTTEGSWTAGVDGQPGIIMPGSPETGVDYRQEYSPGNAVDNGRVVDLDDTLTVPFGTFDHVLVTEEWSELEKGVLDRKYYAEGIGVILERRVKGGEEVSKLVDVKPKPATG
jgi:hypothetical protein